MRDWGYLICKERKRKVAIENNKGQKFLSFPFLLTNGYSILAS
jgi:hypothetical protein